ncbi:hypothetical protein VP1G_10799 [Cytospora mali]|uniref:Uncharacterized protein n=1 Tax=Cytospora mali TaxID=578113 RepID=A0A194UWD0_CYTMA|nr:hypothetical protein VP1G_10799 [Valsa mali var. pyri (nom. inval.)]
MASARFVVPAAVGVDKTDIFKQHNAPSARILVQESELEQEATFTEGRQANCSKGGAVEMSGVMRLDKI